MDQRIIDFEAKYPDILLLNKIKEEDIDTINIYFKKKIILINDIIKISPDDTLILLYYYMNNNDINYKFKYNFLNEYTNYNSYITDEIKIEEQNIYKLYIIYFIQQCNIYNKNVLNDLKLILKENIGHINTFLDVYIFFLEPESFYHDYKENDIILNLTNYEKKIYHNFLNNFYIIIDIIMKIIYNYDYNKFDDGYNYISNIYKHIFDILFLLYNYNIDIDDGDNYDSEQDEDEEDNKFIFTQNLYNISFFEYKIFFKNFINIDIDMNNNKNIYGESDYYTMYSKLFKK